MEELEKQHVTVPSVDLKENGLEHIDPYVYACIKRYMNTETKKCFPSLQTLMKDSGLSRVTIIRAIERLESSGFLEIERESGKANIYKFNDTKKFEMFSYDFLDKKDLTPKEKAYLVASQQFMFKGKEHGGITFSSEKLAENIGISLPTLRKTEETLEKKGVLTKNLLKRNQAGLGVYERIYDFDKFANLIALKFNEQDQRIDSHEYRIQKLEEQLKLVLEENERLRKEVRTQIIL